MPSPHPPRFWWLKRLAPAVFGIGVAWAGFHWWLTRHVEASLATRVEAWRAEGDAPLPEQIGATTGVPPATVDGQPNAAALLVRAFKATAMPTPAQMAGWTVTDGPDIPLNTRVAPGARQIADANAPALDLARRARAEPAVDWDSPAFGLSTLLPYLNDAYNLSLTVGWAMAVDHRDGRIGDALERSRDLTGVARLLSQYCPAVVNGLVTVGIDVTAADRLCKIVWFRPPAMDADAETAAWRQARPQAMTVIGDLLDADYDASVARRSFRGERVLAVDAISSPRMMVGVGLPSDPLTRPFVVSAMSQLIDTETAMAATPTDFPSQRRAARALDDPGDSAAAVAVASLRSVIAPSLDRSAFAFARARVQRRTAAVVLAAKLFHAETGRWPASFGDLVPAYLPRVPDDPFAAPGTSLRLRTDTPVPLVYSVGEDATDDGGSSVFVGVGTSSAPAGYPSPEARRDWVVPLYLPPLAAQLPETFNVWYWLVDPATATKAAYEWEDQNEQQRAEESAQRLPDQLGVENQQRRPEGEDGEQDRPREQQRDAAQTQPAD